MNKIIIYTDGSSKGNPGSGGWAAIISSQYPVASIKEIGGREEMTTNNRMEMKAVIEGLRSTPENSEVEIHTDSEYVLKGASMWIWSWQKNNWRTKDKREVLNKDLWEAILEEMGKRKVEWQKVLGHSGHKFNERCDEIATELALGKNIKLYQGPKEKYLR